MALAPPPAARQCSAAALLAIPLGRVVTLRPPWEQLGPRGIQSPPPWEQRGQAGMREVVTVQVGGFANFVGSHFWNFQVIS